MKKYLTKQGDTWDIIAMRSYGNVNYMVNLIASNQFYADIIFFEADIELSIPEIDVLNELKLPSWRS